MDLNEYVRALDILYILPTIRKYIEQGKDWDTLKPLCEPLGLTDTAFRDHPRLDDYLVSYSYWMDELKKASEE